MTDQLPPDPRPPTRPGAGQTGSPLLLLLATLVALGMFVAGFAAGRSTAGDATTASGTANSGAVTPPPRATKTTRAAATPSSAAPVALGTLRSFGQFTVTYLEYREAIPDPDGDAGRGNRLDGLRVRACNINHPDDADGFGVGDILGYGNITLLDANDGAYKELDLTPSPAPLPQLESNSVIAKGACKEGWLALVVPKATRVVTAAYEQRGQLLAMWSLH